MAYDHTKCNTSYLILGDLCASYHRIGKNAVTFHFFCDGIESRQNFDSSISGGCKTTAFVRKQDLMSAFDNAASFDEKCWLG